MVNNLILVPDIQEAKCSEFTVQILLLSPPHLIEAPRRWEGQQKCIASEVVKNYKKENSNIKEWI